jgi:Subtilase family
MQKYKGVSEGSRALASLLLTLVTTLAGLQADAFAGVASLQARWTQPQLTACFMGGDERQRAKVRDLAETWLQNTGLQIDFGAQPEYRSCAKDSRDHLRIAFEKSAGTWSVLGKQTEVPAGRPTMNLDLQPGPQDYADHQILHELGHALGILHQEQHPRYECRQDLQVRYDGKSPYAELSRPIVPDDGKYLVSAFDSRSVMRAFTWPEHFSKGEASPCYGPPVTMLSADDRDLIARMYPARPPDVSSATVDRSISIVLEGALSQENYQYLIPVLRKNNLIGLRQYVDHEGLTPGQIMVRERLSPTGAISKDLERYLCQENPHICRRSSGSVPIWSNQKALTNTAGEPGECGAKDLNKSVFCLPNIRVQSQRVFVESDFDPSKITLADHVVNITKGCDAWNEGCQAVVELSNANLNKRLYRPRLQNMNPQTLTLPAQIYRVPVEFRTPDDRKRISESVEEVKRNRAKQLGVDPSEIAIRLLEPVGNPTTQQFQGLMKEPVQSYADALLAMNYPFVNEESQKEFASYAEVHVALWDRRVDTKHCELVRDAKQLVFVTPFNPAPQLDPAPNPATECAAMYAAGAKAKEWWDHGTHIAGILAAQINGKGIAGVNPKMTLWSWELVDGSQFSTGDDPTIAVMADHRINPKIINISQTFPRGTEREADALEAMLFGGNKRRGAHNVRLIVAAAGVDRNAKDEPEGISIEESYKCRLVPACWSQAHEQKGPRNLISVVALDRKGEQVLQIGGKKGSNYGFMFDVAAVGEVTSTMHGHWIGTLAGSSMAAPYVTGLASLIEGKARSMNLEFKPSQIKERILVTADRHTPELKESSRYGRINFGRALDFMSDVVVLKPGTGCTSCTLKGHLVRAPKAAINIMYVPEGDDKPTIKAITLLDLRRLVVQDDVLTVHFHEEGRLRTISGAQFIDGNAMVTLSGKQVLLGNIQDFTAAVQTF